MSGVTAVTSLKHYVKYVLTSKERWHIMENTIELRASSEAVRHRPTAKGRPVLFLFSEAK